MRRAKRVFRPAFALSRKFYIHVFILLLLWALAFWNLVLIIIDYRFDNHDTFVKLVPVKDTYPFLDDAHVCIDYGDATIFAEVWSGKLSNSEVQARRANNGNSVGKVSALNKTFLESSTLESSTLDVSTSDDPVSAVVLLEQLRNMDKTAALCAAAKEHAKENDKENAKTCTQLAPFENLEAFLGDSRSGLLKEEAWNSLRRNIVREIGPGHDTDSVSVSYLSTDKVCFSILLSEKLSLTNSSMEYALGVVTDKDVSFILLNQTSIDIEFPGYEYSVPKSESKSHTVPHTRIQIRNAGAYDEKRVSGRCTDETISIDKRTIDPFDDDCKFRKYLETVREECECTPFTYYNFAHNSSSHTETPFCSARKYKECLEEIKLVVPRQDAHCEEPCIIWKNDYQLLVEHVDDTDTACLKSTHGQICASAFVTFQCQDQFYTVYEQQFRLTIPHLLAEIGGILSFFTGFSILGLWRLIWSVSAMQQRRKKVQEEKRVALVPSWPSILVTRMENGSLEIGTQPDVKISSERLVRDVELRLQSMQNDMSALTVSLGALEAEVWRLRQAGRKSLASADGRADGRSSRNLRRLQRKVYRDIEDDDAPATSSN